LIWNYHSVSTRYLLFIIEFGFEITIKIDIGFKFRIILKLNSFWILI